MKQDIITIKLSSIIPPVEREKVADSIVALLKRKFPPEKCWNYYEITYKENPE